MAVRIHPNRMRIVGRSILGLILGLAGLALSQGARAAPTEVRVLDQSGQPADFAVVMLTPTARPVVQPPRDRAYEVLQKNRLFQPFVSVIPKGSTVQFPNGDDTRHHVYSFSKTKSFEFPLYGAETSPALTLDKTGPIPLGCNIHDHMLAFIYVTDAPYYAVADADGIAYFEGIPAGEYRAEIWHPDQQRPVAAAVVTLQPGVRTDRDIALKPRVYQVR